MVTEDYPPNVKLARARLGPLGVGVVHASLTRNGGMPFASGSFDLVLNRHSGLNGAEVARILAPGGVFFTQQIHGLWTHDLLAEFGATPQWSDAIPEATVSMLERAELRIVNVEVWQGDLTFHDVGAIVYYLRAVPWLVPGFSVETMDTLMRLQGLLQREGPLVYEARKYLIEARKPG